jgi:tripartite-type tricarboxylate transporter receptor subunit TctC
MKLPRRKFLRLAACAAALPAISHVAREQAYPSRPVRIVIGFPAGSGGDMAMRMIGQWLSERLGQPFVIENRPGAANNIATEMVVKALPDGHTLLMVNPSNAINATLYEKLNFNFLRDIAPVATIYRQPLVLNVNPSIPVQTVSELIAYAKANPDKFNMASGGNGSGQHVAGELFKMMTGIKMLHVPYRGGVPAMADLMGGQVQVMFELMNSSIGHIRAGKIRPLAVTTAIRSQALPDIPTIGDFVPGYDVSSWLGVGAPRGTSLEIIDRLNKAFSLSPADFGKLLADETEKWGKVIKFANIKPD